VPGENNDRPGNGTCGGCGHSADERLDRGVLREALVDRRHRNDDEIDRKEHTQGGKHGTLEPVREVANESDGDDHGAGRDHRDRDGIEELMLVQPVMRIDDATMQERHDRQTAAKDKQTRLHKEEEDRPVLTACQRGEQQHGRNGEQE